MSTLIELCLLFTVAVAGVVVVLRPRMDAELSTDCRVARRSLLRQYRRKQRPIRRPTWLSHLTDEQWQSHMEAFVDYQLKTGKYSNFTGFLPEWLESEGLPPSPLVVPQYSSTPMGNLTGWVNTAEEEIRHAKTA